MLRGFHNDATTGFGKIEESEAEEAASMNRGAYEHRGAPTNDPAEDHFGNQTESAPVPEHSALSPERRSEMRHRGFTTIMAPTGATRCAVPRRPR